MIGKIAECEICLDDGETRLKPVDGEFLRICKKCAIATGNRWMEPRGVLPPPLPPFFGPECEARTHTSLRVRSAQ